MSGADRSSGSGFVAADAQFGVAQILKPFPNFEDVYQGKNLTTPIAFPGVLDPSADKPGFSKKLLAGLAVPMGARIQLWIPVAVRNAIVVDFDYLLIWRMRNIRDFRNPGRNSKRSPFHFPRQSPGAPDGLLPRFVIPAGSQTIVFDPPLPGVAMDPAVSIIKQDRIRVGSGSAGAFDPFTPGGLPGAVVQQGVLDASVDPQVAGDPIFALYSTYAQGDELIIYAFPSNPPLLGVYDFNGNERPFSNVYGKDGTGAGTHPSYRDVGIYVLAGTQGPDTVPRTKTT
jgi:hypothetical protein